MDRRKALTDAAKMEVAKMILREMKGENRYVSVWWVMQSPALIFRFCLAWAIDNRKSRT